MRICTITTRILWMLFVMSALATTSGVGGENAQNTGQNNSLRNPKYKIIGGGVGLVIAPGQDKNAQPFGKRKTDNMAREIEKLRKDIQNIVGTPKTRSPQQKMFFLKLKDLLVLANSGNALAQFELADRYNDGLRGVKKDSSARFKWLLNAAKNGHILAQNLTGFNYLLGEGVEKNVQQSVRWFWQAAQNGNYFSQYQLGQALESGRGIEKNLPEALKWYKKAAAQGHQPALVKLQLLSPPRE